MFRLSGQLRRQLGKKVLELGGNAVFGYHQSFDLEAEEHDILARAIGTAVRLSVIDTGNSESNRAPVGRPSLLHMESSLPPSAALTKTSPDEELSHSPPTSLGVSGMPPPAPTYRSVEQQILTLDNFPRRAILGIGGFVSAASVKIIDNDDKDVREMWWNELRDELKAHSRALGCHFVIGYSEHVTINAEVEILHCTGTAANVDLAAFGVQGTTEAVPNVDEDKAQEMPGSLVPGSVNEKGLGPTREGSPGGLPIKTVSLPSFEDSFTKKKSKKKHFGKRREELEDEFRDFLKGTAFYYSRMSNMSHYLPAERVPFSNGLCSLLYMQEKVCT